MESSSNTTLKVIGAFLGGALAGAAIGILFAPDKGSQTRSKIITGAKDMAEEVKNKVKEQANSLMHKAEELEHLAKDKIHEMK